MAADKDTSPLMNLPLEVRHTIFEYAAVRNTKPKKLLRCWFEKKEVKELVANEVAANPTGPAPRVMYNQEHEIDSDTPAEEDEEDQDGENSDEDEGEDDEVDQEQGDQEADDGAEEDVDEEAMEDDETTQAQSTSQTSTSTQGASLPTQTQTTTQTQTQHAGEAGDVEDDGTRTQDAGTATEDPQDADGDEFMAEGESEDGENDEDSDGDDADEGVDADEDGNTNGTATVPQQPLPPPAPVVSPARKWRHIPNFMRITHCPPPVELLLASKQLNEEAKNWFYDVAVLRINATGSFAHTSFFEEAFRQITDAAFSPMENVRKVAVLFAWDTTWLRAEDTGCAEAIFPALLRQRSDFVYQILSQAPDLKEVTIHWHDSAQDIESANFMLDILAPFHGLNVHLAIKEHYIAADAKPHKRSIAGQRRVEFEAIVDAGLDRLF